MEKKLKFNVEIINIKTHNNKIMNTLYEDT